MISLVLITSNGSFKAKATPAYLMDALQQFHAFGFKVSLLILDGASSNLTVVKILVGVQGVFGHDDSKEDHHSIQVYIPKPFMDDKIFIICAHHIRYACTYSLVYSSFTLFLLAAEEHNICTVPVPPGWSQLL